MRLGLLADIHEDTSRLAAAITRCRKEGVDRLLTLGDLYETGARFSETVAILEREGVEGVWGNHDIGLCHEPQAWVAERFSDSTRAYLARLRPRLEVEGVLLGHVLPFLDPTDPEQPWYLEAAPETADQAAPNFAAFPHARMFVGHFHGWRIVTASHGALSWSGDRPFAFEPSTRYLVIVAAVCDGYCAIHDTEADVLTPLALHDDS
jgi:hypothetical protein